MKKNMAYVMMMLTTHRIICTIKVPEYAYADDNIHYANEKGPSPSHLM